MIGRLAIGVALAIAGCARNEGVGTSDGPTGLVRVSKKEANAVPPNYRELVARKILERFDASRIRGGEISQPGEGFMNLMSPGYDPTVRASIILDDEWLPAIKHHLIYAFQFQNGQVAWMQEVGKLHCQNFRWSSFRELLNRKRSPHRK